MLNLFPDKHNLSPGQSKIADFIERHPGEMLFMTEQEIADRIGTSIATVSRFWRAVGYDNAKAFKGELRSVAEITPAVKLEKTMAGLGPDNVSARTLEQAVAHLRHTAAVNDPAELEYAAGLAASARRLYVHAPGPSLALGELLHYRLSRFGLSVKRMAGSGHEVLEPLAHLRKEDAVLLFGFTRMLPETEVILDCARRTGTPVIWFTDREEWRYGMPVAASFYAGRGEMGEFHSMLTPLLLIEQLILSVGLHNKEAALAELERLGELRERYADKLPRGRA